MRDLLPGELLSDSSAYLRVFISHSAENVAAAEHYARLLEPTFKCWYFERDMPPGFERAHRGVSPPIEAAIRGSHYFLLLMCDRSMSPENPYCARELGLALALQEARREEGGVSAQSGRPIIIPIYCADMSWRALGGAHRPQEFPVRDFWTGDLIGTHAVHGHDPLAPGRDDAMLRELMRPRVMLGRRDFHSAAEVADCGLEELYEALFPPGERDNWDELLSWSLDRDDGVLRAITLPQPNGQALELDYRFDTRFYYVSLYGQRPAAFCFVSIHPDMGLIGGNYIAVARGWRGGDLAGKFRDYIRRDIGAAYPDVRGIVIDVEVVDFDALDALYAAYKATGAAVELEPDSLAFDNVRKLRRAAFYELNLGACAFVAAGGRAPLVYSSPRLNLHAVADDPDDDGAIEVNYWLMWVGAPHAGDASALWAEAVNFFCVEVQGKTVIEHQNADGAAYWDYCNAKAEENIAQAAGRVIALRPLALGKRVRQMRKCVANYEEIEI